MENIIKNTLAAHDMLPEDTPVLVALSGGADSVALLHVLQSITPRVYAVHINHGLRPSAQADQDFAQDLCNRLGIPMVAYQAPVTATAKAQGITIEEAGRNLRYQYFSQGLEHFNIPQGKIATGHHQNDHGETIVLNLIRGTGLLGLCGIPYTRGNIIRPLLDVSRTQIENYLNAHNVLWVTDETNLTQDYTRNKIRHSIIPALEAINPSFIQTVTTNAHILREEDNYLNTQAKAQPFNCESLGLAPIAIARRMVRQWLPGKKDITTAHVNAIINLATLKSGAEVHVPGYIIKRQYNQLVLVEDAPPFPQYDLPIPSHTFIPALGAYIAIANAPIPGGKAFNGIEGSHLTLRSRKPGDTIIMQGAKPFTKKIQDYFSDNKTPVAVRDHTPLLAIGNNILWVLDHKGPTSAKYQQDNTPNQVWVKIQEEI